MPQNIERDFQKAALKLKHKNKNILRRKISISLLTSIITTGLLYFIYKQNLLAIANVNIGIIILITLIISSVVYFSKNKLKANLHHQSRSSVRKLNYRRRNHSNFLDLIKIQHWLIFLILLVSANLAAIKDIAVRGRYNPAPPLSASPWSWKNNQTIHPIIASITPDLEISIKSVAEYIARQESDPYLQIKALHDYVISRVSYDFHALETGVQPSQDAQTVFSTRTAVCGGYANLFMALGQAIGIDAVVIQGNIRLDLVPPNLISQNVSRLNPNNFTLHAWNAVKVAGNWQLIDTTWDDSRSDRSPSIYKSDYLMPPPEVMIKDHLPDRSDWQLLNHPIDREYFEKQIILTPRFFSETLQITLPVEYKTITQKDALIQIKTPLNYSNKIIAIFSEREKSDFSLWSLQDNNPFAQGNQTDIKTCQTQSYTGEAIQISCQFSGIGIYKVLLFSSEHRDNIVVHHPIAQLKFDAH
jgi:Transglutaminase-like superfamily